MHILDALDRHQLQLRADGRSPHTSKQYERHVRLLATWLASAGHSGQIEGMDEVAVARFLASDAVRWNRMGKPRLPGSANAIRTSIKGFCAFLHEAGLVPTNAARLVRPALTAPPPPRAVRPDELERLLAVIDAADGPEARRDAVLVRLLRGSGIRLASALSLRVEDVDLAEGTLLLRQAKGQRDLRSFLPSRTSEMLGSFIRDRRGPVFASASGRHLSTRHVQRRFRAWRERAGLPPTVRPHGLRHGFALDLYERTGDLAVVSRALGHSSIATTTTYARASDERVQAALQGRGGSGRV